jgi:hypothetical protein
MPDPVAHVSQRPEIRVVVTLDPRRPHDTVKLVSAVQVGPLGDTELPVEDFPVPKVIEGPGFEVHVDPTNTRVFVRGTPEGKESVRRLGISPQRWELDAWEKSTAPVADPDAEPRMIHGGFWLWGRFVRGKSMNDLLDVVAKG